MRFRSFHDRHIFLLDSSPVYLNPQLATLPKVTLLAKGECNCDPALNLTDGVVKPLVSIRSMEKVTEKATEPVKFGTFWGAFVPNILTILGVIMFLRTGWVVGLCSFWSLPTRSRS